MYDVRFRKSLIRLRNLFVRFKKIVWTIFKIVYTNGCYKKKSCYKILTMTNSSILFSIFLNMIVIAINVQHMHYLDHQISLSAILISYVLNNKIIYTPSYGRYVLNCSIVLFWTHYIYIDKMRQFYFVFINTIFAKPSPFHMYQI